MNLRDRLIRFMYGRYGLDGLTYCLLTVYITLAVINMFTKSLLISAIMILLLIYTFFRVFSRNTYKRRAENDKFMRVWLKARPKLLLYKNRIKYIKTYRYRKCKVCRNVLRLPRRKGVHMVECPCCKNEFKVKILF